jgi:hypothetical protein
MGSTAIALAKGIRQSDAGTTGAREVVVAFDLFTWADWMYGAPVHGVYNSGDSFLPEARRIVRNHAGKLVKLVQADLSRFEWQGGPIKLLLVDAMKSPALAAQIARSFFPTILPGGILIHQDFKHYYTSWIHVLQYELRDFFRLSGSAPNSGTVAFELVRSIPGEAVKAAVAVVERMSDADADACFRYSLDLLGPDERVNVGAAHVAHYCHCGNIEKARETLQTYQRLGWSEKKEFPKVIQMLANREAPAASSIR